MLLNVCLLVLRLLFFEKFAGVPGPPLANGGPTLRESNGGPTSRELKQKIY